MYYNLVPARSSMSHECAHDDQHLFSTFAVLCHAVLYPGAWCSHEPCRPPHGWRHCGRAAQLLPLGPQQQGKEDTQEAQGQQQVDPAAQDQARLGCEGPSNPSRVSSPGRVDPVTLAVWTP
jgi:hypothetical protein